MAIDPQIALGYRPPQVNLDVPSPIQQFGQMMTLRGLMEQQQMRRQDMAQQQMQMDAARRSQAAEADFRQRLLAGQQMSPQQVLGTLGPTAGMAYLKNVEDIQEKQHKNTAERMNRLGSIIGSATDAPTYTNAIMQALTEQYLDQDTARNLLQQGYNPARVKQYRSMAMTAEQQATAAAKEIEEKRLAAAAAEQSRLHGLEYASQTVPEEGAAWQAWRSNIGQAFPLTMPLIPPQYSPGAYQLVKQFGVKPKLATPGVDVPYSPAVQEQKLAIATAGAPRMPSVGMTPEAEAQQIRISQATQQEKPPTEAQAKAQNFWRRMQDSEQTFAGLEDEIGKMGFVGQSWYNYAPNFAQSSTNQVLRQAQRQFTESRLRKESGAAIAPSEYENDARIYFPQPGDSAETIARKKAARAVVMDALAEEAGKAHKTGAAVPKVGDTYNGGKVKSVTRLE